MKIEVKGNFAAVISQLRSNVTDALGAMGRAGVESVLDTMNNGYERRIYRTGALQRSMVFRVDEEKRGTVFGTALDYSIPVHEGAPGIKGRPFLQDGLLNHRDELRDAVAQELKKGF